MNLWLTIMLAGALTFAIRLSFIGTAGRMGIPAWFERMLRFVPVAALTALIWPDLLVAQAAISLGEPRLFAGLLAALIAWRTGNVLATIGGGMVALWMIQWLR